MKVALIQMNSQGDKGANLAHARRLVEQAVAEERPDLVALPETWTCLSDDDAGKRAAAEPVPGGEAYGLLQELAARHRIVLHEVGRPLHVTTGRLLREAVDAGLYNIAVMLNARLDLLGASVHASTGHDWAEVEAVLLTDTMDEGIALMAEVAT